MKTPIILMAAAALAASSAAAANFDINDGGELPLADISSGHVSVDDCTSGLHVDVLHGDVYDDQARDWTVDGVRIAVADHHTEQTTLAERCLDMALSVVIEADGHDPIITTPTVITDGVTTLDVPLEQVVYASAVTSTSVLVERDESLLTVEEPTGDVIAAGEPIAQSISVDDCSNGYWTSVSDVTSQGIALTGLTPGTTLASAGFYNHALYDGDYNTTSADVPVRATVYAGDLTTFDGVEPLHTATVTLTVTKNMWLDVPFSAGVTVPDSGAVTVLFDTDGFGKYTDQYFGYEGDKYIGICLANSDLDINRDSVGVGQYGNISHPYEAAVRLFAAA